MSWSDESYAVSCYCCDHSSSKLSPRWHSVHNAAAESTSGVWIFVFLCVCISASPTCEVFGICKSRECVQLCQSQKKLNNLGSVKMAVGQRIMTEFFIVNYHIRIMQTGSYLLPEGEKKNVFLWNTASRKV